MNKTLYRILAFVFGLITLGGFSETYRIMTSNTKDIASQRLSLMLIAFAVLVIMLVLTGYFWKKSK